MTGPADAVLGSTGPDELGRLAEAGDRDALVAGYRDYLAGHARALQAGREAHAPVGDLVRGRARAVDDLLGSAWRFSGLGDDEAAALVAVGGYGRGELHPHSDVDILVLLAADPTPAQVTRLQAFLTVLWDSGLELGHSVRTPAQCVELARDDVTIITSLVESRQLTGNVGLYEAMSAAITPDRVWPTRAFFEAKRDEQTARHRRFHGTAYNLEPNVKEGPGGLRDIQVISWVARRHFGAGDLAELVRHGFLTASEYEELDQGRAFLWEVRLALHLLTGRREDRLLFDHQRRLAQMFGYLDDDANLAVEKFMKRYYRAIMALSRLNEMLLELFEEAILLADRPLTVTPINRRFRAVNGFLDVTDPGVFRRYPFALLELFLVLQQHQELKGVRAATIRLVREHRHLVDENFRADIRARSLFLEILKQPRGISHEFWRMNRYGILAKYLPVFGAVVGQMQFDLFHAYTVDEHTLFVLSHLRAYSVEEHRHEHPLASEVFERLPKPWILYIAGLFHDIAKGQGGDHSRLGAELVQTFCEHHGLSAFDGRVAAWLVENHLLMSVTAQRRDISDPDVINDFAAKVRDHTHLQYLYLLTVADIRGTNPNLWNDWKGKLLLDLFLATERALRRGLENPLDRETLIDETQSRSREALERAGVEAARVGELWHNLGDEYFVRHSAEEVTWHTEALARAHPGDLPLVLARAAEGGTEIFTYANDQKYLFAASTTVLGRLGLSILDAKIITAASGMTMNTYVVLDLDGRPVREAERLADVRAHLTEALRAPGTVRGRTGRRRARRQVEQFETPTEVSFYDDVANARTVMEVLIADRPGLLAVIGWALADSNVRLQNAKIATYGERAEDVFFVSSAEGEPLDEAATERLRDAVAGALADAGAAARGSAG